MVPVAWFYEAANYSIQLVSFALWCTGGVIALRHRPRPGTTLAATGFGFLAANSFYMTYVLAQIAVGSPENFDLLLRFVGSIQPFLRFAGIALVIVGVRQAWSTSWNDDFAILRPSETDDQSR